MHPGAMDAQDVGVAARPGLGLALPAEALRGGLVGLRREALHRDAPAGELVPGEEHLAHAALAEPALDRQRADPATLRPVAARLHRRKVCTPARHEQDGRLDAVKDDRGEQGLVRRAIALLALRDARGRARGADKALSDDGEQDGRARLAAWINGVVRRRRSLHVVIGAAARRALKERPPVQVAAMELGAFRVLWGEEPPERVADEVAAAAGGKKAGEHVRRVVLAVGAALTGFDGPHADPDGGDDRTLPVSRERTARFGKPLLEVTNRGLAGRLGVLHSLPDALVDRWVEARGAEVARALAWAANDPPPLFARVNPLRTTREAALAALAADGITAVACDLPGALRLDAGRGAFRGSAPWRAGQLTIQDLTAQRAALLLAPREGERLLDLCAAPGTKTTGLAELAGDRAPLLACDRSGARLAKVARAAQRLGLTSIRTRVVDGRRREGLDGEGPFDAALVDGPCTNTGVLRRRAEARWRFDAAALRRLTRDQAALLATAAALVRPGGRIVYSVCSIEPDEGSEVARGAAGLELEDEQTHLPSPGGGDGGYLALLRRRA